MNSAATHKENLERTAMRLFRRQGYASTGLQQILAESGAPKGSLYHYFPDGKEAIGEAAVRLAGAQMTELLSDLAARHRSPEAFLAGYARTLAGWMEESDFRSGCPIATTLLGFGTGASSRTDSSGSSPSTRASVSRAVCIAPLPSCRNRSISSGSALSLACFRLTTRSPSRAPR